MPSKAVLTVHIRFRWWWWPYFHTLSMLCALFDVEPNWERVENMLKRAVYFES